MEDLFAILLLLLANWFWLDMQRARNGTGPGTQGCEHLRLELPGAGVARHTQRAVRPAQRRACTLLLGALCLQV